MVGKIAKLPRMGSIALRTFSCLLGILLFNSKLGHAQTSISPNQLFDSLVEYNLKTWNEKTLADAKQISTEQNVRETAQTKSLAQQYLEKRKALLKLWKEIIIASPKSFEALEARFNTALILWQTGQKNSPNALNILREGLHILNAKSAEMDDNSQLLAIKYNIFTGNIFFTLKKYSSAKQFYSAAEALFAEQNDSLWDEKIRTFLSLGDLNFFQNNFSSSSLYFDKALATLLQAKDLQINLSRDFLPFIQIRIAWSAYRGGNYTKCLTSVKNSLQQEKALAEQIPLSLLNDLYRISGVSLMELNEFKQFHELATDVYLGDMGKKIVIQAFPFYLSAGKLNEIDFIAKNLEDSFQTSSKLAEFYSAWSDNLKLLESKERYYTVVSSALLKLQKGGSWQQRVNLTQAEETTRHNFILQNYKNVAEYYAKLGEKTQAKSYWLKSQQIYTAYLQEGKAEPNKFPTYFNAATAALQSEEFLTAWQLGAEAIANAKLQVDKIAAHYLLVQIGKANSERSTLTTSEEFAKYLSAVDAFVFAFPKEKSARLSLFESAKRCEKLSNRPETLTRFQRLLALLSATNDSLQTERDALIIALLDYYKQESSPEKLYTDLQQMDKNTNFAWTSPAVRETIQSSYSAVALAYADNMRKNGKLQEAATLLIQFGRQEKNNPQAPNLLFQGILYSAELGQWLEVENNCIEFISLYPQHKLNAHVSIWLARSKEENLDFATALSIYSKTCTGQKPELPPDGLAACLEKGAMIAQELKDHFTAGLMLEKLSMAPQTKISPQEKEEYLLSAIEMYLAAKDLPKASNLTPLAIKYAHSNEHKLTADSLTLEGKFNKNLNFPMLKPELEKLLSKFLALKTINPKQTIMLTKQINNYLTSASNYFQHEIQKQNSLPKQKDIQLMLSAISFLNAAEAKSKDSPIIKSKLNYSLGVIQQQLSQKYSIILAENKYLSNNETMQIQTSAEIHRQAATRNFNLALFLLKSDQKAQNALYHAIKNVSSIQLQILPVSNFKENQNSDIPAKLENYLLNLEIK